MNFIDKLPRGQVFELRLTRAEFEAIPDRTWEKESAPPEVQRWRTLDKEGNWWVCGDRVTHHIEALKCNIVLFSIWRPVLVEIVDWAPRSGGRIKPDES